MSSAFLIYGANGFVGSSVARQAIKTGLRPVIAGRNSDAIKKLAHELELEFKIFDLDNPDLIDEAIKGFPLVLHCAGPYIHTADPMARACIRTGTHYMDITGEIPVYENLESMGEMARSKGVMLLPGIGFDVAPTDCLALHLKQKLPAATRLTLAFQSEGPAGLPPGTQKTAIELVPFGERIRRKGQLVVPEGTAVSRQIDFGAGPVKARRTTWGDVFTAYYSTEIPNIENYIAFSESMEKQISMMTKLAPLFKTAFFRNLMKKGVKPGPSVEECNQTSTHVWGEVVDADGNKVIARLHGPEAGLIWTSRAMLAAVKRVLSGDAPPGYQTPAKAFGADFILECEGVSREDVIASSAS